MIQRTSMICLIMNIINGIHYGNCFVQFSASRVLNHLVLTQVLQTLLDIQYRSNVSYHCLPRNETRIARNETRIVRKENRLAGNENCLARNFSFIASALQVPLL